MVRAADKDPASLDAVTPQSFAAEIISPFYEDC